MLDAALAALTLSAPLFAALAIWRVLPGMLRWLCVVPFLNACLHAVFLVAEFACEGGFEGPWGNCRPSIAFIVNPMRDILFANLTVLFLLTPGLLILAGIGWLVRREKHST
ncbi:MAG TPA: hypothetical protein DEF12_02795 [Rhodobacteraceae bacterium]|jgi:hypothetical protein|nr:hypothetical protein [Paracoccaceae bacterium]